MRGIAYYLFIIKLFDSWLITVKAVHFKVDGCKSFKKILPFLFLRFSHHEWKDITKCWRNYMYSEKIFQQMKEC